MSKLFKNNKNAVEKELLKDEFKRKSEELEMLLDCIDTHILYLKTPEIHGYVNKAAANFMGIEKEEFEDRSIYEFHDKEQADIFIKHHRQVFETKKPISYEHIIKNKDGVERTFLSKEFPKLNKDGDVEYVICAATDITEQKEAEKNLRESLDRANNLANILKYVIMQLIQSQKLFLLNFEESCIGMVICNMEGKYIEVNKAFCKMLGYEKEGLINRNFKEFIHKDDLDKFMDTYNQVISGKIKAINFEHRYVNKNGDMVWVNHNASIYRGSNNNPLYLICQIEDITEKKRNEEEIKKQREELEYNRLRTQFFARLSHEFRTPLNLIFSSLQLLKNTFSSLTDTERQKAERYTNIIRQNSLRLLKMVNNVLDITKINSDNYGMSFSSYDIVLIIRKIVESIEDYIKSNNRTLEFTSSIDSKFIVCNPFSIERIMLNLISNAVKFTNEGDTISISIFEEEENVIISVKDTGIGIKPDKLDIIFEQFRQADESFTKRAEGSGIGLSIVKSLVELHGGHIWVESEYGEGTNFFIKLPTDYKNMNLNEKKYEPDYLIDKIDVEFSDIYT